MAAVQSVVLGIVQGITECLPVSSSAHFVLVPWILDWQVAPDRALSLAVLDELGALLALFAFFWTDVRGLVRAGVLSLASRSLEDPQARLAWQVALATVPAALAVLVLPRLLQGFLSAPTTLAAFLLGNGVLLLLSDLVIHSPRSILQIRWPDAVLMGLAQAIGLLPGLSRWGMTMASGRFRKLSRLASARFSFWMAMPILLERAVLGIGELARLPNLPSELLLAAGGFVTTAVVGFLSIGWMLRYLTTHSLRIFAFYCFGLGFLTILVSFLR